MLCQLHWSAQLVRQTAPFAVLAMPILVTHPPSNDAGARWHKRYSPNRCLRDVPQSDSMHASCVSRPRTERVDLSDPQLGSFVVEHLIALIRIQRRIVEAIKHKQFV